MPVPVAYTEVDLAKYMARVIGPSVAGTLEWHHEGQINAGDDWRDIGAYAEAVNETLIALAASDVDAFTTPAEIQALRAVARWQVWRHVRMAVSDRYDESLGGGVSMKRSQLFDMATRNEMREFMTAWAFVPGFGMRVAIVPVAKLVEADAEFG